MSNIDKRALREAAAKHGDDDILALLDELEAEEKRIAELTEIIRSGRKFISEYAGLGDIGAAEFIKIIDRAAAGKGEES